jgi:hypothetical protein
MRELRAERYAAGASPTLIDLIRGRLPYFSFNEAMSFYEEVIPQLTPSELALLGCNDRFFLLTGLLNRPDAIHPWLYDRIREVDTFPDGYLDLWARGHYKSSVITFAGCIQETLVDPNIRIGIFSHTKEVARPFLSQIKEELENNEELKALYPDVLWDNPRKDAPSWSVDGGLTVRRSINPKECTIEAHGLVNGMPTGRHFPLLVYDDIITERNVTNPDQIKKATSQVEMSDNLGIGDGTRKWFVGTRYSYADSYQYLIDEEVVIPRVHPATDNGRLDGNPVFLAPDTWEAKKKAQRSTISAQMLQNPMAGNENTFHPKWLRPYWVRPIMMNVYIMVDPSKGRSKSSDRTAMAVVGIDSAGNKYLLDGYCHRMSLSERWKFLKGLWAKWKKMPGVQRISVGYERYGMQSDEEYFEERMRLEGISFEIEILNWTGQVGQQSKENRVERLEPDFRLSSFFVPGKVWKAGTGECRWFFKDDSDEIQYEKNPGPHAQERRAHNYGELWRLFDPLRRVDEDGNIYDVTRVLFEEFTLFPFSPRDDFVDAMSRIYDMDPMPAQQYESQAAEVEDYPDA